MKFNLNCGARQTWRLRTLSEEYIMMYLNEIVQSEKRVINIGTEKVSYIGCN